MPPALALRRAAIAGLLAAAACAPRARPITGAPAPERLPNAELPEAPVRQVFTWRFEDPDFTARGEGALRTLPPDSARLDLWLEGGLGGGWALLLGDSLVTPGPDLVRRLLPEPPLLWAAAGRLAVPAARDTTAAAEGDVVRADIGRDPTWRVTFVRGRLARLERIEGGRIVEWVSRAPTGAVRYRNERSGRSLSLTVTRTDTVSGFDAAIWHP